MIRFEEVQSQKGGRNLVHGGYRLRKSKEKNGRQYWSCIVKGCRARATTVVGTLDGAISAPHDHPPCISRKKVHTNIECVFDIGCISSINVVSRNNSTVSFSTFKVITAVIRQKTTWTSVNAPIDQKTRVALEDLLKTAMTSDAVFGDNGDDAKSEQKEDTIITRSAYEEKRRRRIPRKVKDEILDVILQKERDLFCEDIDNEENDNLRKRRAWNEVRMRVAANHPEMTLTVGVIRRFWRGTISKMKAHRNRFKLYCSGASDGPQIVEDCPFTESELNVFCWLLAKRSKIYHDSESLHVSITPAEEYQQQSASFSIDDENEKSVRDYAELSVSDCNDSRDECGNDAVDSGADGLRPKPTEDTAADGQLCSPQVSFLQEQTAFIRETKTLMQSMYRLLARQVRLSEEQLRISERIDSKLSALIKRQSSAMHCELSEPSTCDGGQECGMVLVQAMWCWKMSQRP
uniref:FLYWCH-type domain-containing protein n=1 Tax=Ascaris lumbricoides TaxID=6252 RepID=A0A0M3IFC0_ASCLU